MHVHTPKTALQYPVVGLNVIDKSMPDRELLRATHPCFVTFRSKRGGWGEIFVPQS